MRSLPLVALSCAALLAACGDDGATSRPIDAAEIDAETDAAIDAPIDAAIDAPAASCTPRSGTNIALAPVATGLDNPVGVTAPPGDRRIFIVEQTGAIRILANDTLVATPYLSLGGNTGPVLYGGERGLLGLAFHPQFATNGKFYVNFTAKAAGPIPNGATVIAEFTAAAAGDNTAPIASRRDLLVIPQPYSNHNGGWLEFGNDGFLYIGMGDGGSGGDPQDYAQNDASMLGKMLRIDVNNRTGTKQYAIPASNPFASSPDGAADPRPEIYHKGLRNPFRFSFDRANGDLYIGDVGQGAWEEVDWAPANMPGINWGWDDREGAHCFEPANGCLTANRREPVTEHPANANWHSVIGGAVYRGTCFPDLVGTYFYGDYVAGELWSLKIMNGAAVGDARRLQNIGNLTHIHADATGELYVTNLDGRVRKIVVP